MLLFVQSIDRAKQLFVELVYDGKDALPLKEYFPSVKLDLEYIYVLIFNFGFRFYVFI